MTTQIRERIIDLGKVLASEQRRGCDDSTTEDGLEAFLHTWRSSAGAALEIAAVQAALALLADYGAQTLTERRTRVTRALEDLRGLFRDRAPVSEASVPESVVSEPTPTPRKPRKTRTKAPERTFASLQLQDPVEAVPGIGKKNADAFKRLGLRTVEALVYHFPHRYDDYSSQKPIAELAVGDVETIVGEVSDVRLGGAPPRRRVEVLVSDSSGSIRAVFFNQAWLTKQFPIGRMIVLSGKVSSYQGLRQMTGPTWEPYIADTDALIHTGRVVPVYPLTRGLQERNARTLIKSVVDALAPRIPDHLPVAVRDRANLLDLPTALAQIHYPDSEQALQQARRRLAFDEFLLIQIGVVQRKLLWQANWAMPCRCSRRSTMICWRSCPLR
jgi:ATP-dependent DNA helicase RecG